MFCATFYSFKGGVGRTLALANVAAQLAQEGRRVLVVDFDLEAPGLTTLPAFDSALNSPGILDFVSDYVRTGIVPPVSNYLRSCEVIDFIGDNAAWESPLTIDVMSAGSNDDGGYAARLARVDWNELYDKREGFLLMEELRAAWEQLGYDYVLIDSRTGLTDVGGICTRQLPDAVVAVFFPNEQNLAGLKEVVNDIRKCGARPQEIEITFVGSRVPRLDDEHGDLRRQLDRFAAELGYSNEQLTLLEQYDSLMLLNQELFVLKRRNSGLARQYREVSDALKRLNLEDPDGALSYVNDTIRRKQSRTSHASEESEIIERLKSISRLHEKDSVVQYGLARAYYRLRSLNEAAISADAALRHIGKSRTAKPVTSNLAANIHRIRLRVMSDLGRIDEASESANAILHQPSASSTMVIDALNALTLSNRELLSDPLLYPAIESASHTDLLSIAARIGQSPSAAFGSKLAEIGTRDLKNAAKLPDDDRNEIQLMLISERQFTRAAQLVDDDITNSTDLQLVFNTAVATWGKSGKPDRALFEQALALFGNYNAPSDANMLQCRALTEAVLGRVEDALRDLSEASTRIKNEKRTTFSCWTFSIVDQTEFERHLDEMKSFIAEGVPLPELFRDPEAGRMV